MVCTPKRPLLRSSSWSSVVISFAPEQPSGCASANNTGPITSQLRITLQHNVTCGDEVVPAVAYALTVATDLGHSATRAAVLPPPEKPDT